MELSELPNDHKNTPRPTRRPALHSRRRSGPRERPIPAASSSVKSWSWTQLDRIGRRRSMAALGGTKADRPLPRPRPKEEGEAPEVAGDWPADETELTPHTGPALRHGARHDKRLSPCFSWEATAPAM